MRLRACVCVWQLVWEQYETAPAVGEEGEEGVLVEATRTLVHPSELSMFFKYRQVSETCCFYMRLQWSVGGGSVKSAHVAAPAAARANVTNQPVNKCAIYLPARPSTGRSARARRSGTAGSTL